MERDLKQGLVEHRMGEPRPKYGTQNLGAHVSDGGASANFTPRKEGYGHGRI